MNIPELNGPWGVQWQSPIKGGLRLSGGKTASETHSVRIAELWFGTDQGFCASGRGLGHGDERGRSAPRFG